MSKIGNTLKETQEKLIELLGFDYDTIKCSSIFEQGESDSFSKLTPKESKEVVMKILQLDRYSQYEKLCREKYKVLFEEGQKLQTTLSTYESSLNLQKEDPTPYQKELSFSQSKRQNLEERILFLTEKQKILDNISRLKKSCKDIVDMQVCPTCKQSITSDHKQFIEGEFNKEICQLEKSISSLDLTILPQLNTELSSLWTYEGGLKRKLVEIEENNLKIDKLVSNLEDMQNKLKDIKSKLETYKILVGVFGRNGIPSFVIESVVPEIEQIANSLLSQLDVDIQIILSLQKELKSGGTSDTLDINVVTRNSIRTYKNYSGGEKFLIDFSLRIALSILLLRRKGCNNSTLLLDEGMGSLDDINRDKLVRLINLVREQYGFRKILVISHIDDIQSAFDKKIHFIKSSQGITEVRYNYNEEELCENQL